MPSESAEMTEQQQWIKISGKAYHGSFPASFADSLSEMQRGFYRTAALALHGDENIKRLTREELARFEITFEIKEGSTEIYTDLAEKIESLITEAFRTMPTEYQAILLAFAVACYFGSRTYDRYCQKEEAANSEAERTKQMQIIEEISGKGFTGITAVTESLSKNAAKLTDSVLRNATGAETVQIADTTYTADDIAEAGRRNRFNRQSKNLNGNYRITIIDATRPDTLKLTLQDEQGVSLAARLDTDDLFADDIEKIWQAAQSGRHIPMQITAVYKDRQYEKGYIVGLEL